MGCTQVTFKFKMDEAVVTPFGDVGIIQMLGYDDGGEQYFIKTSTSNQWYKEKQLEKSEN